MSIEPRLAHLLLVEPDSLFRRTVAGVAREMRLAQVQEATSIQHAADELAGTAFDAVMLALDPGGEALKLLQRLRDGQCAGRADTQVAVMAEHCDAELAQLLRLLNVRRLLLKPFKVKGVVETISGLCSVPAAAT